MVQRPAIWHEPQMASSRRPISLHVKDRAFEAIAKRLRDRVPTTEYDIQQLMAKWFVEAGMVSDSDPNVSAAGNAGNPHYLPTANASRAIRPDDLVLLDLWGKLDRPDAVYADITWVGYTGREVPGRFTKAFDAVRAARDAAVSLVQNAARSGRELRGWEVDRAAASVLVQAGYAKQIMHRTGHSLGESVHGDGVNMDDTGNPRRSPAPSGTGYYRTWRLFQTGVRSEINLIMHEREATVSIRADRNFGLV